MRKRGPEWQNLPFFVHLQVLPPGGRVGLHDRCPMPLPDRSPISPSNATPVRMRAVVFDLDGTLIESLPLIAAAVNKVAQAHGFPPFEEETVRAAIGDGARVLIERLFSSVSTEGDLVALLSEFLTEYTGRTADESDPWRPGARALLDSARAQGLRLAILTNKPLPLTEAILAKTDTRALFDSVRAPENSPAPKPDPRALTDLLEEAGLAPEETIFVGDSVVDFETGARAGVETIGLRGGYGGEGGTPPDLWLDDPPALAAWLDREVDARERV